MKVNQDIGRCEECAAWFDKLSDQRILHVMQQLGAEMIRRNASFARLVNQMSGEMSEKTDEALEIFEAGIERSGVERLS